MSTAPQTLEAAVEKHNIASDLMPLKTPIYSVLPDPNNANQHPQAQLVELAASLQKYGQNTPIVVTVKNKIIRKGNGTWEAATQILGWSHIAVVFVDYDETTATGYAIADNRTAQMSSWDYGTLGRLLQGFDVPTDIPGITQDFIDDMPIPNLDDIGGAAGATGGNAGQPGALLAKFVIPPFTVLDARQGYWLSRKRAWLEQGIRGEHAPEMVEAGAGAMPNQTGLNDIMGAVMADTASTYDPVLCELAYRWYCPNGGRVLDPFCGSSVGGAVAGMLSKHYLGIDISPQQVAANRAVADKVFVDESIGYKPRYINEDSAKALANPDVGEFDLIFSCPPYGDLEIYSQTPGDISNMQFDDFMQAYGVIMGLAAQRLKNNRFAVLQVGDFRDTSGYYRNFVSGTIQVMLDAGMQLYNEAVLVTSVGTLPVRVSAQFSGNRKMGKAHQNILVFVKGDWRQAVQDCGEIDVTLPDSMQDDTGGGI